MSNGVYKPANLTLGAGVTVRSKNNISGDVILDGNAVARVITMLASSKLIGCTITNGLLEPNVPGGGVYGGIVSNCIITGNSLGAGPNLEGGGAAYCTLYNCSVYKNQGYHAGGGGYECTFYNCIVSNNTSAMDMSNRGGGGGYNSIFYNSLIIENTTGYRGGGGANCSFYNSTIYGNTATPLCGGGGDNSYFYNSISWGNNDIDVAGSNYYSCGVGYIGTGSITNDPKFVGVGNYHLQNTSLCKDTGNNGAWSGLSNSVDLAGSNRIFNAIVDMGAYEYYPTASSAKPKLYGVEVNKLYGVSAGKLFGK